MDETNAVRFSTERFDLVTSIGLVRINPLGDCVVSLMSKDGTGVVLRLFDPERSLDALSQPDGKYSPHADFFKSVMRHINETERQVLARSVFFYREDDRWRAIVKFEVGSPDEGDIFWVESSPQVALATFSVENIPSYIAHDESSTCDLSSHRAALLFGLRGGEDFLEGLRSSIMRNVGITIHNTGGDEDGKE